MKFRIDNLQYCNWTREVFKINREAGLDPDEGGIDVPQSTDGITRYPSQGGEVLPADDVAKFDGQQVDDEEK